MKKAISIGEYLIEQLHAHGVGHVFGIPGDYVLGFYDQLAKSKLVTMVNTCDEQGAGFAADAYARMRGLGAVCITYCVGGLKVANATAGAYAEKSPVVVISGAPGMNEREKNPLLHHKVKEFDTQKKVFEQITVASTVLSDAQTAFQEIDRVLHAALRYKRPVYIELPRDMVFKTGIQYYRPEEIHEQSDTETLRAALAEAEAMINKAKKPVWLADVEVHRFGLQDVLMKLVHKTNIPVATTVLGKSVIGEQHSFYLGVYEGALGRDDVRRYVEGSDCVVMLGAFLTDINLGIYTAQLDPMRTIYANSEKLSIRYHTYENVRFKDFMRGLLKLRLRRRKLGKIPTPPPIGSFRAKAGNTPVTVKRLYQRINDFLGENMMVVADVGDALFGATDLFIRHRTEFLAPAYYASMGFAVPAGIGAQMANRKLRPLVLVGDGAFQMTGMELSTAARYGLNPIVILLNNFGYGTERHMQDGAYNDVLLWHYSKLPEVLGAGKGFLVKTEGELDKALEEAKKCEHTFCLLDVQLDPADRSPALQRLAERLALGVSSARVV
ncbi:alpha-keto acid decarboxylase family protein [Pedosphaera parvula]|uniref:Thiamine pyrophosphate protein TPP binding domain protein n=1 Tax=Pedosphaera parvula (strain Ellin514) TaxID=320771 RepID=B9XEN6_PEDPL|nr:thiamine pyrophosphate-dependent enzyme [Pedosphaera parvula]EEF61750.1 thiamine pyrophosphate protein TPP binding domain protein [Pedosphaera parvula Ellin514]